MKSELFRVPENGERETKNSADCPNPEQLLLMPWGLAVEFAYIANYVELVINNRLL